MVLCAGFVSPPRRDMVRRVALILAPALLAFGLPESVCRHFLVGDTAPQSLVDAVRATVSSISSEVLAHRLRSVLNAMSSVSCEAFQYRCCTSLASKTDWYAGFRSRKYNRRNRTLCLRASRHLISSCKRNHTRRLTSCSVSATGTRRVWLTDHRLWGTANRRNGG